MADDINKRKKALQAEVNLNNVLLSTAQSHLAVTKSAQVIKNNLVKSLEAQSSLASKISSIDTAIDGLLLKQVKSGTEINQKLIDRLSSTKQIAEETQAELKAVEAQNKFLKAKNNILKDIFGVTSDIEAAVLNGGIKALILNKSFENISKNAKRMGDSFQSSVKDLGFSVGQAAELQANIEIASFSLTGMVYGAEAVAASGKAIAEKYGSASAATSDMIKGVTQLSSITGDASSATDLAQVFKHAGVEATEVKGIISDIAKKEGMSAKMAMQGMSDQMSQLVGKTKEQLKTIIKSNAQLIKQGTNMKQIEGISNAMLDIESSMKAGAKARIMLGHDMNTNAVRAASLELQSARSEEDRAKARKKISAEILKGVGGMEKYAQMTMKEKDATAAAYGMSTDELTTMMEKKKVQDEMTAKYGEHAGLMAKLNKGRKAGLAMMGGMAIEAAKLAAKMALTNMLQGKSPLGGGGSGGGDGGDMGGELNSKAPKAAKGAGGGLKSLADGLKAMGDGKVFAGIAAVALAGPAFIIALPAIPFLLFMGKVKLKELRKNLKGLADGLNFMSSTMVGSIALAVAAPALVLANLGIPFLLFMGKIKLKSLASNFIQLSTGLIAMGSTFAGIGALALFAVAGALAIPSLIFLGGIALLGAVASAGLIALAGGLAALGNPATAGFIAIGIGLIALLGLSMIPFAFSLSLVTPLIKVFGDIIIGVFTALPPIIAAVADGFVSIFSALTPEALLGMLALGPALMLAGAGMVVFAVGMAAASAVGFFGGGILDDIEALALMAPGLSITAQALGNITTSMGGLSTALMGIDSMIEPLNSLSIATTDLADGLYAIAGGLAAFSIATLMASPAIVGLGMLGAVAPALESLGEFFGTGGGEESQSADSSGGGSDSSALLDELKGLRGDIQSQPILITVDGKVVSQITKIQAQQGSGRKPFQT